MKISEVIAEVDALQFNEFGDEQKIAWLDQLDRKVKLLVVDACEGSENVVFNGYTADTPTDTVLLIPDDFREIYRYWLCSQIDLHNREHDNYNRMIEMFNASWDQFCAWYNRTHRPVAKHSIRL